jgi:protein tyrosine phosphatase (PTP) superfamily phosphohydrolase (DUF442 family)
MTTQDILNAIKVDDELLTAGQPTVEQLQAAASEGFATVINLGMLNPRYALPDEAGLVQSLGLAYFHIPVPWEAPSPAHFQAFEAAMQQRPPGKTLLHCAANFRATAFYALYALKHLGWSEAQADAFRAPIWKDAHEPAWEQFIAQIKAGIRQP